MKNPWGGERQRVHTALERLMVLAGMKVKPHCGRDGMALFRTKKQ